MNIVLESVFARNSHAKPFDVKQLKKALNRLGYYMPHEKDGITELPDMGMVKAIEAFQKDRGLSPTGSVKPDDLTVRAMNLALKVEPEGYYIWRATPDQKVRAKHASYDYTVRSWRDDPDPGDDFGCRCWAEPATPSQAAWKMTRPDFSAMPWVEDAALSIAGYELDSYWPYLDTTSAITVGKGININQKNVFLALPWKKESRNGVNATAEEIELGYYALRDHGKSAIDRNGKINILADHQKKWSGLVLPDTERDRLFQKKILEFHKILQSKFFEFETFPPEAKSALLDMVFNLGQTRFSRYKWPTLFKAVSQRNWKAAAAQSKRNIPNDKTDRNQKTHDSFLKAAEWEVSAPEYP